MAMTNTNSLPNSAAMQAVQLETALAIVRKNKARRANTPRISKLKQAMKANPIRRP